MTAKFVIGDAVVTSSGRIGMISRLGPTAVVQFGAGGPFGNYRTRLLRLATEDEVRAAGMHGVGFNVRVPGKGEA